MTQRGYRGDSGEMETTLSPREQELLSVAQPRADVIYERHVRLPKLDNIPSHHLPDVTAASSKEEMELDVRRKRLVYRAKQRGWLEVDLLLGTWANQNVSKLGADELDQFESFVNLETIDIYHLLISSDVKKKNGGGVVEQIQEWARASPLGKAEPEKYASVKQGNNLI
jgi:succinate dehydrogenase assembly factor 2